MVGPATSAAAAATAVVAAIATEKAQNQQDWTTLIQKIDAMLEMLKTMDLRIRRIEMQLGLYEYKITRKQLENILEEMRLSGFKFMDGLTLGELVKNKLKEKNIKPEDFCKDTGISMDQYKLLHNDKFLPDEETGKKMAKILGVDYFDFDICRLHTKANMKVIESPEWQNATEMVRKSARFRSILERICEPNGTGPYFNLFHPLEIGCYDYISPPSYDDEISKAEEIRKSGMKKPLANYQYRNHLWSAIRAAIVQGDVNKINKTATLLKNFLQGLKNPTWSENLNEEIKHLNTIIEFPENCIKVIKQAREKFHR